MVKYQTQFTEMYMYVYMYNDIYFIYFSPGKFRVVVPCCARDDENEQD